jgi:acyl-CoA thioester hydrolase
MDGYKVVSDVAVRFSDTDALGHVNNANYLSYLEVARVDYINRVLGVRDIKDFGVILARVEIDYKSPAFTGEVLRVGCRVESLGGSSIVMDYTVEDKASGRLVAVAKTVLVVYDYKAAKVRRMSDDWRRKMEEYDDRA